jgi:uncharacterized protein
MKTTIAFLTVFISSAAFAGPPSFCTADHSAVARLICADAELSNLEVEVFGEFNSWRSNVEGPDRRVRERAHGDWIRERNALCGLNSISPDAPLETLLAAKPCMVKEYEARKQFYDAVMWK